MVNISIKSIGTIDRREYPNGSLFRYLRSEIGAISARLAASKLDAKAANNVSVLAGNDPPKTAEVIRMNSSGALYGARLIFITAIAQILIYGTIVYMSIKTNLGGRPSLPEDERKSERLQILITAEDKELLRKAADVYGITVSEYLRDLLLEEAEKLVNKGKKAAISEMCASVEDKARALGVDVEVKPVFKTYKTVGLSEIDED